jgi:hypothetical protein
MLKGLFILLIPVLLLIFIFFVGIASFIVKFYFQIKQIFKKERVQYQTNTNRKKDIQTHQNNDEGEYVEYEEIN